MFRLPKRVPGKGIPEKGWWTRWDSNPRPRRCERRALPAELLAHALLLIYNITDGRARNLPVTTAPNMRRDWDRRARENARHYVVTGQESWTDEEFYRSGQVTSKKRS